VQSAWVEQVRRFNAAKLAGPVPISVAQFHDSTNASMIIISHCRFQSLDSTNASRIIISHCRFQSHDSTNASTIIISHADFSRTIPRFYKCFKRINICHCRLQSRDSTNASTIIISDCRIQSHDSTILQTIVIISLSLSLIADFRSTIPRFYNCFNDHHIETWRKQRVESHPKCCFPGRIESNSKITARQTGGFSHCLIPQ